MSTTGDTVWNAVWAERRYVSDYERAFLGKLPRLVPAAGLVLEAGCGRAGVLGQMLASGRWSRAVGLERPVVWAFAPEHVEYAGELDESLLIYYVTDEPTSLASDRETTEAADSHGRLVRLTSKISFSYER